MFYSFIFFFSSRRRHTRWNCDWSSDVCSSDLAPVGIIPERSGIFRTRRHTTAKKPQITRVSLLKMLLAGALVCSREVEIAYPVVGGRAEPDSPLRVQEKFPHHGLGMWEGIFHDLAGARIQMANQIL